MSFSQKRHRDGQQAHEKMHSIANYQRNANQNHEVTSHWSEWLSSKSLQMINAGEGVEKRKLYYTVGRSVNWYSHYGKQYGGSLKTKNRATI